MIHQSLLPDTTDSYPEVTLVVSVPRVAICIVFIASQACTFAQTSKCRRLTLPSLFSFTHWLACHTDYQVVCQGQSIHAHEDERKRGGAEGGEDQGGNERVGRGVGNISTDLT